MADEKDVNKLTDYARMTGEIAVKQNKMLQSLVRTMSIRDRVAKFEKIDVNQLINDAKAKIGSPPGVQLKFINKVNTQIVTDHSLVLEILFELIDNSIQFADASKKEKFVNILFSNDDKNFLIEVADNGIGMSSDVKDHVFDMFYRGSELSKGSGLGLYLVGSAIEKLNAKIEHETQEFAGTSWKITLPRLRPGPR